MEPTKRKRPFWKKKRFIFPLLLLVIWLSIKDRGFLALATPPAEMIADLQADGIPLQTGHYEWAQGKIGYLQLNQGSRLPSIVFVHGTPGACDNYLSYFRHATLSQQFQLYAPDRPGFGMSDRGMAVPSLSDQAAALLPILERCERPILLAGHSSGGPVIARMAMDYPELVDGLLLIAPSVDPALEPPVWWRRIMALPPFRWLLPLAFRVSNDELIPLREELEKMRPLWSKMSVPTIVMHGTEDWLVPFENTAFVQEQLPASTFLTIDSLPGADHFILWSEVPRTVGHLQTLANFYQ